MVCVLCAGDNAHGSQCCQAVQDDVCAARGRLLPVGFVNRQAHRLRRLEQELGRLT